MGLGKLFTRSTTIDVTKTDRDGTVVGAETFVIRDDLAPTWGSGAYSGGMGIPGAYRCATLMAALIGGLPWGVFEDDGDGSMVEVLPTPPVIAQPAPPETRMSTFAAMALDLIWDGNAVFLVASLDEDGFPDALIPIPASMVSVRRVTEPGMSTLPVGSIEYAVGTLKGLSSKDVIHIKGFGEPGALRGLGLLEAHVGALGLARELSRQAGNVSRTGVPTGLLKVTSKDITVESIQAVKSQWLASQRDRTVGVLNQAMDFEPLAWKPEEMQLVEARKFSLHEMGLLFGMPLSLLGIPMAGMTYSNMETESLNVIKFSAMAGLVPAIEQTLSQHMRPGREVRIRFEGVLRSDTMSRFQAHAVATGGKPFMTVDEVRRVENLGPIDPSLLSPPGQPTQPTSTVGK